MAVVNEFRELRKACDAISRYLLWPHKPPPEREDPELKFYQEATKTPVQTTARPRCPACMNQAIPVGGSWFCQTCNVYVGP